MAFQTLVEWVAHGLEAVNAAPPPVRMRPFSFNV